MFRNLNPDMTPSAPSPLFCLLCWLGPCHLSNIIFGVLMDAKAEASLKSPKNGQIFALLIGQTYDMYKNRYITYHDLQLHHWISMAVRGLGTCYNFWKGCLIKCIFLKNMRHIRYLVKKVRMNSH